MRFIKKVIPPKVERRKHLMRKLAFVKDKKEIHSSTKRSLREEIARCDGAELLFIQDRGREMFVGYADNTPRKRFLMYKNPMIWQPIVQQMRQNARKAAVDLSRRPLTSLGQYWTYEKTGGVFTKANTFGKKDREVRCRMVARSKKPRDNDSYIGLEMEFATKETQEELMDKIADYRLHRDIRVVNDSSIRTSNEFPNRNELCVLTRYTDLDKMLDQLKKLVRPDYFQANASCGLHVHLDVRNDDPQRVYRNLANMQGLLFKMAAAHRSGNSYCHPVQTNDFLSPIDLDHYAAISKSSYMEHRTVEVRIHHSTTDMDVIGKWVKLLKRIADYKGQISDFWSSGLPAPEHRAFTELRDLIKPGEDILNYVKERLAV
jgi:hypothetical protein